MSRVATDEANEEHAMNEGRIYYRVIKPDSTNFGLTCEYVETTKEGKVVLLAGRPWRKLPLAFDPSEVQKVEEIQNGKR
jgi:hypothetical protein